MMTLKNKYFNLVLFLLYFASWFLPATVKVNKDTFMLETQNYFYVIQQSWGYYLVLFLLALGILLTYRRFPKVSFILTIVLLTAFVYTVAAYIPWDAVGTGLKFGFYVNFLLGLLVCLSLFWKAYKKL